MADMPLSHFEHVSKSNISKIVTYCRNDVGITHDFFFRCIDMIETRVDLVNKYVKHHYGGTRGRYGIPKFEGEIK